MAKSKVFRKQTTMRLRSDLLDDFDALSSVRGVSRTQLFEEAARRYLRLSVNREDISKAAPPELME